jgi:hypothetical protein
MSLMSANRGQSKELPPNERDGILAIFQGSYKAGVAGMVRGLTHDFGNLAEVIPAQVAPAPQVVVPEAVPVAQPEIASEPTANEMLSGAYAELKDIYENTK